MLQFRNLDSTIKEKTSSKNEVSVKSLKHKKMNRKILFLILLLMGSVLSINAQEVQLATLQQGEDLQVFYGADALKNSLDAANHGDLITLTAGSFNAVNITKAVTIQGAGYVTDAENGRFPTVITGRSFDIQLPEDVEGLAIEGLKIDDELITIRGGITSFSIKKCHLEAVGFNGHSKNCLIEQSIITRGLYPDAESENLHVKNSIIKSIGSNTFSASLYIENCLIIRSIDTMFQTGMGTSAFLKNNIIGGISLGGHHYDNVVDNVG